MRIGIITFHYAWNYGAALQCAALKSALEALGHWVCVIDYVPEYGRYCVYPRPMREAKSLYRSLKAERACYRLYRAVRRGIKTMTDVRKIPERKRRRDAFTFFQTSHMNLTRRYASLGMLRRNPPKCDAYITGSDQLWNPSITGGAFDPSYFLDFGDKDVRRIAYAVSALELDQVDEGLLRKLTSNLTHVSLRENRYAEYIKKVSGKPVQVCVDPTILLETAEYEELEENVETEGKYILLFLLYKGDSVEISRSIIKGLSQREEDLKVIDASPQGFVSLDRCVKMGSITPGEWLSLIHNAQYVVTNSFHCLALSTIYQKECFIVPCAPQRIDRLTEFANKVGISERCVFRLEDASGTLDKAIDWTSSENRRAALRTDAIGFLKEALTECKGKAHQSALQV